VSDMDFCEHQFAYHKRLFHLFLKATRFRWYIVRRKDFSVHPVVCNKAITFLEADRFFKKFTRKFPHEISVIPIENKAYLEVEAPVVIPVKVLPRRWLDMLALNCVRKVQLLQIKCRLIQAVLSKELFILELCTRGRLQSSFEPGLHYFQSLCYLTCSVDSCQSVYFERSDAFFNALRHLTLSDLETRSGWCEEESMDGVPTFFKPKKKIQRIMFLFIFSYHAVHCRATSSHVCLRAHSRAWRRSSRVSSSAALVTNLTKMS